MINSIRQTPASGIVVLGHHHGIIQSILDFDYLCKRPASIVAIVTQNRKAEKYFWGRNEILIPCVPNTNAISTNDRHRVQWMLNLQSSRKVFSSTVAFFKDFPQALGGHIFAENVPESQATELISLYSPTPRLPSCQRRGWGVVGEGGVGGGYLLVGPSGVGLIVPGFLKLGAIGGVRPEQIEGSKLTESGSIAVGSTSGGMTNELIQAVVKAGKTISFAAAVGGDRFPVLSLTRLFELAEADPQTKAFVYFGELGGTDEYEIIELIKQKRFNKPIVAYIAGVIDEAFTEHTQFGHAKALVQSQDQSARAKRQALRTVGVTAPDTFAEFLEALQTLPSSTISMPSPTENLSDRRASILSTRKVTDLDKLGGKSFTHNAVEALLGQPIKSDTTAEFVDTVFSLLIDHGGNVSGAVNTMITARAGKDMISSLTAGLLTIGPRFGGAVNASAQTWFSAVQSNMTASQLVETENKAGRPIMGIGHKKYRLGLPDPRVESLSAFADKLPAHPHYDLAREVEKITTQKSGSLILNVDGVVAALLLDLLSQAEELSTDQLKTLIDAEFFNAFFIIPRTVGFISHFLEQKQNDEGLFRLPDDLLYTRD